MVSDSRIDLRRDGTHALQIDAVWIFVILSLTIIIGFRYEVGGDWANYYQYLASAANLDFSDLLTLEDPGYWALNILSNKLGFGITGVNVFGALLFSTGLVVFCRSLPRAWLALACAMPYLVTVVAMGYTRQAIALGFVMIGLVMLSRTNFKAFVVWVLLGALFHKSAVLMIPIAALTISTNRWFTFLLVGVVTFLSYSVLLESSVDRFIQFYSDEVMQSSGALIRLAMNLTPAVLFLVYRKRIICAEQEKRIWTLFALMAIFMFFVFFPTSLSTALDRMALYLIPLQLFVFAHLPDALGGYKRRNQVIVVAILIYYAAVMFTWLNFASHSRYWVPYNVGII
ncbi:EpsG family protein [Pontixanthobacter sp.]|uniref:EpsG family protein n=1 Tax=Pontixanthobacter sp. TaxID=2792078 RepID=UPI003C7E30C2